VSVTPRSVRKPPSAAEAAAAAVTPGTISQAMPAGVQRRCLLGAAAEDAGIAALEAHDAFALAGGRDHQRVDAVLRPSGGAGGFADEDALGVAAGELERVGIDQAVV
jgi:hypothetical protein